MTEEAGQMRKTEGKAKMVIKRMFPSGTHVDDCGDNLEGLGPSEAMFEHSDDAEWSESEIYEELLE